MRRWLSLNGLLVAAAALAALVLTVTRPSPAGLFDLGVGDRVVRAAPGDSSASVQKHNLAALKIFNRTLIRIRESYVDPSRIDPKKMLYAALDSVQFNIPEVMIDADASRDQVDVVVNDKKASFSTRGVDSPWRLATVLKHVFRFVETNMNPGADLAEVEYAAVNGMLSTLDPHSLLLDPEMAREMDVNTGGEFGGLGIVIGMRKGQLTVIRPMKGTPAWTAGIKANDHIVKINNDVTENLTLNEAVDRMRGKKGSKVTLWVQRKGSSSPLRFDVVRAQIRVASVEHQMLGKNVGYIRLKQFAQTTASEVKKAVADLRKHGARAFVIDLRWNPGGLLEQAIQVVDEFVDHGTIVTTVGGNEREPRRAQRDPDDVRAPLVLLVNSQSASASEIVAGALKNLNRAAVIGTTTFGKGSVQILYDNDDGSKLKLTIAQYLTPGDISIQSLGITPDIELQRMFVSDQNKSAKDWLHLMRPSHSFREADLKSHLDSTYARAGAKPEVALPYLWQPESKADAGTDQGPPDDDQPGDDDDDDGLAPEDDFEAPADDEFHMDFEIGLARDILAGAGAPTRTQIVKNARRLLEARRADEIKKLTAKLASLGVDWSPAPANTPRPRLRASFRIASASGNTIKAGQDVELIGTVTNTGSVPAYRVHARTQADDDSVFSDAEQVFGKIDPGKSRTWTTYLKVPDNALDRFDYLTFDLLDAHGKLSSPPSPLAVQVRAADRPVFAYSHQLIDESNGDGLVQAGERYKLRVTVKNAGKGISQDTTAILRNASGTDLTLKKTRFELGELKPGDVRTVEFSFDSAPHVSAKEVVVEMTVYDKVLRESVAEKLHLPVRSQSAGPQTAGGDVQVSARSAPVFEGAAANSAQVATAPHGTVFRVTGKLGAWLRVQLDGGRPGFVRARDVSHTRARPQLGRVALDWQVTPPALSLEVPSLEVNHPTFKLKGRATDDTHLEDVYIFVSNRDAKIEGRKVFYRSNRGSGKRPEMSFSPDIPLWPGSNLVTVVARENNEVKSAHTLWLYRPETATATTAAAK